MTSHIILPDVQEERNKKQRERRHRTRNWDVKKYEKTKNGFLMRMYRNMKSRVTGVQKDKFHLYACCSILPKEEFYSWAKDSELFHKLFKEYEDSGYERKLAPSVDRVDSFYGYELWNMEWVTHSENSRRGSLNKAYGDWRSHEA
jgi:hypothetical protein